MPAVNDPMLAQARASPRREREREGMIVVAPRPCKPTGAPTTVYAGITWRFLHEGKAGMPENPPLRTTWYEKKRSEGCDPLKLGHSNQQRDALGTSTKKGTRTFNEQQLFSIHDTPNRAKMDWIPTKRGGVEEDGDEKTWPSVVQHLSGATQKQEMLTSLMNQVRSSTKAQFSLTDELHAKEHVNKLKDMQQQMEDVRQGTLRVEEFRKQEEQRQRMLWGDFGSDIFCTPDDRVKLLQDVPKELKNRLSRTGAPESSKDEHGKHGKQHSRRLQQQKTPRLQTKHIPSTTTRPGLRQLEITTLTKQAEAKDDAPSRGPEQVFQNEYDAMLKANALRGKEITRSFIGMEFTSFLRSTGARVPPYLRCEWKHGFRRESPGKSRRE